MHLKPVDKPSALYIKTKAPHSWDAFNINYGRAILLLDSADKLFSH